jgi:hypothetical protein
MNVLTKVEVVLRWKPEQKYRLRRWFQSPEDALADIMDNGGVCSSGHSVGNNEIFYGPTEILSVRAWNSHRAMKFSREDGSTNQ